MTIAMTLLFSTLQCILKGYCYFVYLDTLIVCFRIHILQNGTNIYYVSFTEVTNSIMEGIITNDLAKKEPNRSLGILCQKFIMLFMVSKV